MATFHVSEPDAARDFAGLMARVRAGAEIIIESDALPIAVIHMPVPASRTFDEAVALLPEASGAVMDDGFASDIEAAIAAHREPLNPPAWD
jgi:antitoxin (DNA-binding transcriptional repressor) of toxin-antitoxin stability system